MMHSMPYSKDHKARSKQKILESARELFLRYGFERVSISQIMKVARMTHGAFLRALRVKRSAVQRLLSRHLARQHASEAGKSTFYHQTLDVVDN